MTTQEKREALAEYDADNWDHATIYDVALEGCRGYNDKADFEINELYDDQFGGDGKLQEN